jgi:ABC-2 type transport system ATP-binding protein
MIEIRNLTKDYGPNRALDGISFSVGTGEILGLLGPNGAGKTTTMRILTGYISPTSGSVRVKDLDVAERPLEAKRHIGYLPEFAPLYADMLVADYLRYIAAIRRVDAERRDERIRALVDQCGLHAVAHRPFRELSRGYKQRVGLAHALMSDPDILVLDEPTAGLDPNQIVEIRRIIREAGRAKTVIFSTHILSEAESTCDRIIIINRGRVVADGTAAEVKTAALSGTVVRLGLAGASFADAHDVLAKLANVLEVRQIDEAAAPGEIWLDVACSQETRRDIYLAIKRRDWVLTELRATGQSLEDTFRELTAANADQAVPDEAVE